MGVNDNFNQSEKQNPENSQGCCPSTSGGGGCCSPASGSGWEKWRALIFFIVLVAAGIVLARSLVRKSNATAEQTPHAFPTVGSPEVTGTTAQANAQEQATDATKPALWGPELDSLAALDEVATDVDTVFILICAKDQQDTQTIIGEIEAATKKIRSRGNLVSAFRLKNDAADYENIAEQFTVPTVLAMVKGLGFSAVSEQITEVNLLEAFVTASRPQAACCPPGTDPSQCAPSNSN